MCDRASEKMRILREIISRLRAPDGCPWDREQTPDSVRKYILEEAYELSEAIEGSDAVEVEEELGDLFFMLLFIARLYEEAAAFRLEDALERSAEKMIRRHPHIFGEAVVADAQEVVVQWQAIKARESRDRGERPSALGNLPKALPALQRAFRVGERASRVGFDWNLAEDVREKIREEEAELAEAVEAGDAAAIHDELGDYLFAAAQYSRKLGINPEEALRSAVDRFCGRFREMEARLHDAGLDMASCTPEELDGLWEAVKAART